MPKQYEAIRDKFIAEGKSTAAAKTSAAKIYNSRRGKKPPVTGSENAAAAEKAVKKAGK